MGTIAMHQMLMAYNNTLGGGGGATDPLFASVVSLLHFDSPVDLSRTFNDVKGLTWASSGIGTDESYIRSTQSKFGGASFSTDTHGISTSQTPWNFGTADFTIEFWMYPLDSGSDRDWMAHRHSSDGSVFWLIRRTSAQKIRVYARNGGGVFVDVTTAESVPANAWTSLKIQRKSQVIEVIIDTTKATLSGTNGSGSWPFTANPIWLGQGDNTGLAGAYGYIDEFRATKALRQAGPTYTVEVAPFPNS